MCSVSRFPLPLKWASTSMWFGSAEAFTRPMWLQSFMGITLASSLSISAPWYALNLAVVHLLFMAVMGRWGLYVLKSVCHHGIPHIRHTMRREFGCTVETVWVTHVEHGLGNFGRCDAERLVFCGVGYGSHCLVCVCV
jgi:hypothetical protein